MTRLRLAVFSGLGLFLLSCTYAVQAQTPTITCYPDLAYPAKVAVARLPVPSPKYTHMAVWTCKTPTGYVNELWAYSWDEIEDFLPSLLRGVFDEADARARCVTQCEWNTPEVHAAVLAFSADKRATAKVAASGTAMTRPVYAINPDGTRGALVSGARVSIGVACWLNRRVGGNYYSVQGNPNVATADPADTLGTVAAVCTATIPLGANQ